MLEPPIPTNATANPVAPNASDLPQSVPDTSKLEFGAECYRQIRGEVSVLLARIESLFKYSLLVGAGVFSWVLVQAFGTAQTGAASGFATVVTCFKLPRGAMLIAWWLPTAFIILSGAITLATYLRILQMGDYLATCERVLGYPALSWEAYIQPKPRLFFFSTLMAWLLLLAASIGAAMVGICIDGPLCPPK